MVSLTVKIGKQVKMSMPQHRGCWPNIQQQNKYGAAPAAAAWPHGAKLQPEKKYCMSLSEKRKTNSIKQPILKTQPMPICRHFKKAIQWEMRTREYM